MIKPPSDTAIQKFSPASVIDSCAISNVLCSRRLFSSTVRRQHKFVVVEYVRYECLIKTRSHLNEVDRESMDTLQKELTLGKNFDIMPLTVEELREIARHPNIRNIGRGELASMLVARRIHQDFMTDDRGARSAAAKIFPDLEVRTTSNLAGWLVYIGEIGDSDIQEIIKDNIKFRREGNIAQYIQACYEHAQMLRLKDQIAANGGMFEHLEDEPVVYSEAARAEHDDITCGARAVRGRAKEILARSVVGNPPRDDDRID